MSLSTANINISKREFYKIFPKGFKKKLKESIVPFKELDVKKEISTLYDEISSYKYHPDPPREYIVSSKLNSVARIIPTFTARDYLLYYFTIKMIEDEIAINRVEGTYGGWSLGNKIRLMENEEELFLESYVFNSYNPFLWVQNWSDFQKKAFLYSGDFEYMLYFDIANFYDTINLNRLKREIYLVVEHNKHFVVELLFHFLSNWNKLFDGYALKTVGLPSDEIGDNSRILANFYLQGYDRVMKEYCDSEEIQYLRYADDQIIYAHDPDDLKDALFFASKELYRIGLSINASKVKRFEKDDFNIYWAFGIFNLLESGNQKGINTGIERYLEFKSNGYELREKSILKKVLNPNVFPYITNELKEKLMEYLLEPSFLTSLTWWYWSKMYEVFSKQQREKLIKALNEQIESIPFNSYHYNLMKFFQKKKLEYDKTRLERIIDDLSLKASS